MSEYVTRMGDRLDYVCWKHYGTERGGIVETVLEANPGLASHGNTLPAGLKVTLPDVATPVQAEAVISLWE